MRTCLRWRRFAGWMAMLAMVFMQASIAAHACAGLQAMQSSTQEMPCHPAGDPAPVPQCDAHCDDGAQNVSSPPASVPLFAASFIAQVAVVDPAIPADRALEPALARANSPPLAIRNCCFRI